MSGMMGHEEANIASATTGTKRRRNDSCLSADHDLLEAKRTKVCPCETSAPSTSSVGLGYFPSTSAHTIIPYSDPEWPEHRLVTLPDGNRTEDILWVCGRQIPTLEHVWPPHWPMNHVSRAKKQDRLIADAKEAHHVRLRRRECVRSAEYQAILKADQVANDRRRQELWRELILPTRLGEVQDEVKMRQRCTLFKARRGALDEHERLRRDTEVYDTPGAKLEYLDAKAVAAWRATDEGRGVRSLKVKFRICVVDPSLDEKMRNERWLLSREVEVSSLREPKEVVKTLELKAKKAFKEWVRGQPSSERSALLRAGGGHKRVAVELWAAARKEKKMEEIKGFREWENVLGRMFEALEKMNEGRKGPEKKRLIVGDAAGTVHIYVWPESI